MSLLSCPDVNVWLALLRADHIHREIATSWWSEDQSDEVLFCRFTQMGVLRLLTTASAMNNQPLTMRAAWSAYDRLLQDNRVVLVPEPSGLEEVFRAIASAAAASPKVWADAYLVAFAEQTGSRVVTFDKGLAARASSA